MSGKSGDVPFSADDAQRIENVLGDVALEPQTRRALLKKAALGVAAAGVLTPAGNALAATRARRTTSEDITTVITTAVTAEALAVTYLTQVIGRAEKLVGSKGHGNGKAASLKKLLPVLKAANAAEYDHYKVLGSLGATPLTTRFWIPDGFFGDKLQNVFPTIEVAETLFVNAYLIGVTSFADANRSDLARYAAEICGVEAEHRSLARFAQGKLPDNLAFESYAIPTLGGIVSALADAGVGFGTQGSKAGAFYTFAPPPASAVTAIGGLSPA